MWPQCHQSEPLLSNLYCEVSNADKKGWALEFPFSFSLPQSLSCSGSLSLHVQVAAEASPFREDIGSLERYTEAAWISFTGRIGVSRFPQCSLGLLWWLLVYCEASSAASLRTWFLEAQTQFRKVSRAFSNLVTLPISLKFFSFCSTSQLASVVFSQKLSLIDFMEN